MRAPAPPRTRRRGGRLLAAIRNGHGWDGRAGSHDRGRHLIRDRATLNPQVALLDLDLRQVGIGQKSGELAHEIGIEGMCGLDIDFEDQLDREDCLSRWGAFASASRPSALAHARDGLAERVEPDRARDHLVAHDEGRRSCQPELLAETPRSPGGRP